jgi:uncharacterized protein YegL
VSFERVVPTVWLMIDASGSMNAPLQVGASRYQVVRDALLAPATGLVQQLESLVRFGLYLYDGCGPGALGIGCLPGACPRVVMVEPTLKNFAPIDTSYPVIPPGSSTPTDVALQALAQHIGATATPAQPTFPSYVVLATDGEPNICDWHDGIPSNDGFRQNAVDAVKRMVDSGTNVFAISLASDPALQAYLGRVAEAGGTGKPPFTPATNEELVAALRSILGGAVSCEIKLVGEVQQGKECAGTVTLDGAPLACNQADGWRVRDTSTIELTGKACTSLQEIPTSKLHVSFPCDVYRPIR